MNKTLPNPYYLFSFQHIASKERTSFYPQVITSNVRYDKFRFVEAPSTNLSAVPPQVNLEYLGQYYYSIYENITSGSTDISLAYNKLESGRAWVIVGDDNTQECFFEPYISNDEDFSQVIYVSEEEEACQQPFITPTTTPSNTPTPSITPSITPTMTTTPTNTPTFTPTPSTTPPSGVITPNTLNALWWLDYSDPSYVFGAPTVVDGVLNRTGNPNFYAASGQVASYFPTAFNGVSGATATGFGIMSLSGDYNTSISAYTYFFHFSGAVFSQGILVQSDNTTDYSGNTQGYRWFQSDDFSSFPNTFIRAYTFYTGGTSTSPEPSYVYSANTWTQGAVRVFQTTNTAHTELWVDGILVDATNENGQQIITATNPIFKVGGSGGPDFKISEAFFFGYKLDDTQMGQMFNYLSNKY